jgi:hypothetical protein
MSADFGKYGARFARVNQIPGAADLTDSSK